MAYFVVDCCKSICLVVHKVRQTTHTAAHDMLQSLLQLAEPNEPEETDIRERNAQKKPTCAKSDFGYLSILITHNTIRLLCYNSSCSVRGSDLNKSAAGTKVPPPHLLMAIVNPWKAFQNGGNVPTASIATREWEELLEQICEMCWRHKQCL